MRHSRLCSKKFLVYASEYGHAYQDSKGYGWSADNVAFDWTKLIENKDDEIDRLNGIYIRNLKNAGADIFQSRATLKDKHTVHLEAEGRDVTAEKILIATGGAPWTDDSIPGHDLGVTSNDAFHLEELPNMSSSPAAAISPLNSPVFSTALAVMSVLFIAAKTYYAISTPTSPCRCIQN